MPEGYFAMFDAEMVNLKVVRLVEVGNRFRFEESDRAASPVPSVVVRTSREPQPTLKKFDTEDGSQIYMWRTSMCIEHKRTGTWIHIIDANHPELIPGEYTHKETFGSKMMKGNRNIHYKELRTRMLAHVEELIRAELQVIHTEELITAELQAVHTEEVSPTPARTIPRFVGEIIKRDAVATKHACVITMDEFTEDMKTSVTPCFHIFDELALSRWLQSTNLCPVCKASVSPAECLAV